MLPHLLVLATNVPIGQLADIAVKKRVLSIVAVRKIIQTFGKILRTCLSSQLT
jgi:hypothetical protein